MYVCLCYGITETEIQEAVQKGACSMSELSQQLGVSSACGKCTDCALDVLNQVLNSIPPHNTLSCTLSAA
ncbi:MAG: (2Fe-2S)-binding protein [Gammaproteobacteria bacterium]